MSEDKRVHEVLYAYVKVFLQSGVGVGVGGVGNVSVFVCLCESLEGP